MIAHFLGLSAICSSVFAEEAAKAVTSTPKEQAISGLVSGLMGGGLKGWAAGIAIALALGWFLTWVFNKGIPWLMAFQKSRAFKALGMTTGDPALDRYNAGQIYLFVRLMQEKYWQDGKGPERKEKVLALAKAHGFAGKEKEVGEIIDKYCHEQGDTLDAISAEAKAKAGL